MFSKFDKIMPEVYRSRLPVSFDNSLDLYEQVIAIIEYFNLIIDNENKVTEEIILLRDQYEKLIVYVDYAIKNHEEQMYEDFEEFKNDVTSSLLTENLSKILNIWLENGTLADVINNEVFGTLSRKIDNLSIDLIEDFKDVISTNNITTAFNSAVLSIEKRNKSIYIQKGDYDLNELVVDQLSGFRFIGGGKLETIVRLKEGGKVEFKGCSGIVFEDMTFILEDGETIDKFIFNEGLVSLSNNNIKFKNCLIINLTNTKTDNGTITFWRNCFNISFEETDFIENNISIKLDNNYANVAKGRFDFIRCKFNGGENRGKGAIKFMGTGDRKDNKVYLQNCEFSGFDSFVAQLYHVGGFHISNNDVDDCNALVANDYVGDSPVESALLFLDGRVPNAGNILTDNSFTNIIGVVAYGEEIRGMLVQGNSFYNIKKRTTGRKTHSNDLTLQSMGECCMLFSGANEDINILNNSFIDVDDILWIARDFAPKIIASYYVRDINFNGNTFRRVRGTPVTLIGKVDGTVSCNYNSGAGTGSTKPFILARFGNGYEPGTVVGKGNEVNGFKYFFERPSGYGRGRFTDNTINGNFEAFYKVPNISASNYLSKNNYDGNGNLIGVLS